MTQRIGIDDFLDEIDRHAIIDVRAPIEFSRGHIPGSLNLPLFDNDERARIGKSFKNEGRDPAVLLGLEIVGPKMRRLVEESRRLAAGRQVILHCWRGGMRSASVGWLLDQAGMAPKVLVGGYKAFRRKAQEIFAEERSIIVLSGMTGAGKTTMLRELAARGEQIVDLEGLAQHRGSSFGGIGLPEQPTCEQFENALSIKLRKLDPNRPTWIEDESASIGKIRVPDMLWWLMRRSPAIFLDVNREARAKNLVAEYGKLDRQLLIEATQRLQKKLGGLRTQEAVESLLAMNDQSVAIQLLEYYDKTYQHAAKKRPRAEVHSLNGEISPERVLELARELLAASSSPS